MTVAEIEARMPWREFLAWQRLEMQEQAGRLGAERARDLGLIDERGRWSF